MYYNKAGSDTIFLGWLGFFWDSGKTDNCQILLLDDVKMY